MEDSGTDQAQMRRATSCSSVSWGMAWRSTLVTWVDLSRISLVWCERATVVDDEDAPILVVLLPAQPSFTTRGLSPVSTCRRLLLIIDR